MHAKCEKEIAGVRTLRLCKPVFVVYAISPAAYDFVICGFNAVVKFRGESTYCSIDLEAHRGLH